MWESNHCYCYNIINGDLFLGPLDTGSLIRTIIIIINVSEVVQSTPSCTVLSP